MKRAAIIIMTLLITPSGLLHAEADSPDYYRVEGVAVDDVLNIRTDPDPRAAKVGEIPPGAECIRNFGCEGGLSFEEYARLSKSEQTEITKKRPRWCRVEYQGINGWVAGRYLAEGGCGE